MKVLGAIVALAFLSHGTNGLDVGFSVLSGNLSTNPRDLSIQAIAQSGAQYINTNQTFLTKLYQLIHIPPEPSISGAANTVYKGLLDICSHVAQAQVSAVIVTRDKCPESDDIAGVASHATNPIMSVDLESYGAGSRAFKMYPSADDLNNFFIDVLSYFNWRNFMLLYDDPTAYSNLQGMINYASNQEWNITSIRLSDNIEDHFHNITDLDTSNIFIFFSSESKLQRTLNDARNLELLGPNFTWIVGNLNAIQLNDPTVLSELETSNAYITHFQMNYTREIQYYLPLSADYQTWNLQSKLAFDAVIAFSHGLRTYRLEREETQGSGNALPGDTPMPSCPNSGTDPTENPLSDHLKQVGFEGVTGNVAFDDMGNRVNYTISIFSGQGETLEQLRGEWTQNIDFWEQKWNTRWKSPGRLNVSAYDSGQERKIRIVSIAVEPFLKKKSLSFNGNARFEGFIMDLLERIKTHIRGIDFDYEVELVPDGNYGRKERYSHIWNGMVGEVVRRKADIAAGPLTVTAEREQAVDFSYPFMSSGIKVLVKNPYTVHHYPFRIMYPFGIDVWFVNLVVFFCVAGLLVLYNKLDPFEWGQLASRQETFEENADNFNFSNSLWFCATTLFLQSYDNSPKSNAGRCLVGFWWLFVIVMVFLYLFNLTFFVTTNKRLVYVKDAEDLLSQTDVDFGTIDHGSTYHFFWNSPVPEYQRVHQRMITTTPSVYVQNITEAIQRVRDNNGHYAFIGEAGEIQFLASKKPCDLLVTGGFISRTSYALAVQKGSPLREQLSHAIETLRDTGVLEDLEKDWWDRKLQDERCANLTVWEKQGIFSFTIVDLQGIYYLLLLGVGCALLVFLVEFIWFAVSGGGSGKSSSGRTAGRSGGGGGGGGASSGQAAKGDGGDQNMWL